MLGFIVACVLLPFPGGKGEKIYMCIKTVDHSVKTRMSKCLWKCAFFCTWVRLIFTKDVQILSSYQFHQLSSFHWCQFNSHQLWKSGSWMCVPERQQLLAQPSVIESVRVYAYIYVFIYEICSLSQLFYCLFACFCIHSITIMYINYYIHVYKLVCTHMCMCVYTHK